MSSSLGRSQTTKSGLGADEPEVRQGGGSGKAAAARARRARGGQGCGWQQAAVPVQPGVGTGNWLLEGTYRVFEFVAALILLILLMPIMLLEALLIRLDSPGPSLFLQPRVAKSKIMHARDLQGIPGLRPPPDGYDPDDCTTSPKPFAS